MIFVIIYDPSQKFNICIILSKCLNWMEIAMWNKYLHLKFISSIEKDGTGLGGLYYQKHHILKCTEPCAPVYRGVGGERGLVVLRIDLLCAN